jgi:cytochrome c-type biogenesis protein CcmH/NrfF
MDETLWGLVNIVGPIILLVLLIWVVLRTRRRNGRPTDTTARTEQATHDQYAAEEARRREGTDGL